MYPQQNYGGGPMQDWQKQGADKKVAAGLCGILLGGFGVHKFIMGYQQEGVTMLALSLVGLVLIPFSCGVTALLMLTINIIGLVEGIMYLTKSDEEFVRTYIQGRKGWF